MGLLNFTKGNVSLAGVYYIWKLLMILIIGVAMVMVLNSTVTEDADTREVEATLFIHRLLYTPHGISYYDPGLDKVRPGIIDLSGFDESAINYSSDFQDHIAAKIELIKKNSGQTETIYYNKEAYMKLEPISYSGKGPGSVTKVRQSIYVLVNEAGSLEPGRLAITVVKQ
ncbi:MAG: hypothetical protein R6V53_04720 [Candidatus Woesearchaeota archaeon]